MKKLNQILLSAAVLSFVVGCQENIGVKHREVTEDAIKKIVENEIVFNSISTLGEVDWYEYQINEYNKIVTIEIDSNTRRADVDLLATLYRKDANGNLERIYADHAPENSITGARILIAYPFETRETVYIAVRDLLDDEASDSEYRLKVVEGSHDNQNNSFSGAQPIDQGCITGRIESIGDVDTYSMEIDQPGVYQLDAAFDAEKDSPVQLYMQLFNSQFSHIRRTSTIENGALHMNELLNAGTYYLTVEDFGRDHFDLSSPFELCISSNSDVEYQLDDSQTSAQLLTFTDNQVSITGDLGYNGDQDWYQLPTITGSNGKISVFTITIGANSATSDVMYELLDQNGKIVFSYLQRAGSLEVEKQIKVAPGQYSISISSDQNTASSYPVYQLSLVNTEVLDPIEVSLGDNTLDTAQQLTLPASGLIEGKISYLGDTDWYRVDVIPKAFTYQNLEVWLTSGDESSIMYQAQIVKDEVVQTMEDPVTTDAILDVSTSILIEPNAIATSQRYYIKVSDKFANNSNSESSYFIEVKLKDVQNNLGGVTPDGVNSTKVVFHNEQDEQDNLISMSDPILNIEHNGYINKSYYANADYLAFRDPTNSQGKVTRSVVNGLPVITLPWVAGYIDFANDQDWFELDLGSLGELVNGLVVYNDAEWYYDISITLKAQALGNTEYQWRLYRDGKSNKTIRDRSNSGDGFFATDGDTTLETDIIDVTTNQATTGTSFFAGSNLSDKLYLAIFDANYVRKPSDKTENPATDVDWSDPAAPYYVQVELTYHAGIDDPA